MKGMMVSLLIIAMTGTVVGQQQPTSNQGANKFGPNSDYSQYVAPFELSVDSDLIEGLVGGRELSSMITPFDPESEQTLPLKVVSEISLFHDSQRDRVLNEVFIEPDKSIPGTLSFGLTREDLRNLNTTKFTWKVPAADRGKYNLVKYHLIDTASSVHAPSPDDGTTNQQIRFGPRGNSAPRNQFGQQSTRPLVDLPGPAPGDLDFMGPPVPKNFQVTTNKFNPWTPPNDNRNLNPDLKNQGDSRWNIPKETPAEKFYREQAELAAQQKRNEQRAAESAARRFEAQQQLAIRDEIRRKQRETAQTLTPIGHDPSKDSFGNTYSKNNLAQTKIELENAENARKIRQLTQILAEEKADLEKREKAFEQKKLYDSFRDGHILDYADQTYRSEPREVAPRTAPIRSDRYARAGTDVFASGPVGYRNAGMDRVASPDLSQPSPQRKVSMNTVPGKTGGALPLSIPANNTGLAKNKNGKPPSTLTDAEYTRKTQGFIYFMLLFSLGLNFYLSWISRGFYVRYHELADELRETFTSTA